VGNGQRGNLRPGGSDELTGVRSEVVIFGFRTKVFVLAVLTWLCARCGNQAAHPLHRSVTKFTLFFIPLFPVKTKYTMQCTFCGATSRLSKDEATRLHRGALDQRPRW
jgi:hypothetical protein